MDDLTQIKGIGKATAKKLAEAGIDSFAVLGGLQADDATLAAIEADAEKRAGWIAAALGMATFADAAGSALADQGGGSAPEPGAPAAPPVVSAKSESVFTPIPADDPFRAEFPRLSAAIDAWKATHPDSWPTIVRIRSRREGFRRCNIAHPKAATDHPANRFTPDQMERLLAEPVLTVELV